MPILSLTGLTRRSQWLLTALFVLVLSLLTLAGSFAEVPDSQYLPDFAVER